MKTIDIALKDLLQAFRNRTALVFMFVVPILVTAMFVFLFGGFGGGDEGAAEIPTIKVQMVNLDEGPEGFGNILVEGLESDAIPIPIEITKVVNPDKARQTVDNQDAAVAVIIPANFSAVMLQPGGNAEVEIYHDPTLTLGPSIIVSIVNGFIDGFSGSKITVGVTIEQLMASGQFFDQQEIETILAEYIAATTALQDAGGILEVRSPAGTEESDMISGIIQMVMAGMLIFYAYFTGANMIQSVMKEDDEGTLQRLFTTPTPRRSILYGKFIAACATVFIQALVLFIFGSLVFDFRWGEPLHLFLVVLGITISASTFGVFLISLLKSSKQAGIAMGGGLTLAGMIGMMRIFTVGAPTTSQAVKTMSFFVPHGWALNALITSMEGGSSGQILFDIGILMIWSLVLFLIGNHRFARRFV